jgi:ethanolamine ammonia-lyase small subunit
VAAGLRADAQILHLATRATNRRDYLLRPDWGRQLDAASAQQLVGAPSGYDLALIVSDGLSAFAAHRQIVPLLTHLLPLLRETGWKLAPLLIVPFARVAVQDDIGERLRARAALILLGERPGLLSPDSLGAYLVWGPRRGRTDADRNCVSNIRPEGLPHAIAARTLARLLNEARRGEFSGVLLKDEGDPAVLEAPPAALTSTPPVLPNEPGHSPPTHS